MPKPKKPKPTHRAVRVTFTLSVPVEVTLRTVAGVAEWEMEEMASMDSRNQSYRFEPGGIKWLSRPKAEDVGRR